ncbi:MAG: RDD family protein [Prevotellaceae bacterium]|jgi:uncharacterized RDD family membrane protein YckC|nr:RDD family protein [Prevotellaceae bacterium]
MDNSTKINTAQNVNIDYDLAEISQRIWAFLLDRVFIFAYIFIMLAILSIIIENNPQIFNTDTNFWFIFVYISLMILPYIFYHLAFPYLMQGQTPGKKILGIRIVRGNGSEAGFGVFFIRWLLNLIDFDLFGTLVGLIVMVCTKKHQRIADLVANTVVINIKNIKQSQRPDFEKFEEEYHPVFMHVLQLSDNDVRIIRETFERAKHNGNTEILQKLRAKIEAVTAEAAPEMPDENYIDAILKDYKYFAEK